MINLDDGRLQDFQIPLFIAELHDCARRDELVRIGMPVPRGLLYDAGKLLVSDELGQVMAHQAEVLANWPDRSIKWLLLDILLTIPAQGRLKLLVSAVQTIASATADTPRIHLEQSGDDRFTLDSGVARFTLDSNKTDTLLCVEMGDDDPLHEGVQVSLMDAEGRQRALVIERVSIEERASLSVTAVLVGRFVDTPLQFKCRMIFTAGSGAVRLDVRLRNPRPAIHPGGLWDLGDPGSYYFRDMSVVMRPRTATQSVSWCAERVGSSLEHHQGELVVYQDSSGGDQWNSGNHVDQAGRPTVAFRGYEVRTGLGESGVLARGLRATPCFSVPFKTGWVSVAARDFWQNFPKALRWRNGELSIGVFPTESSGLFELQGGEQKRHTVFLEFGRQSQESRIRQMQQPLHAWVDPRWVEQAHVLPYLVTLDSGGSYLDYVNSIVAGPHAFHNKREIIDEFGWRHFGDLYADHEAVNHRGPQPLISHYNNQYDFIYGAAQHYLRTGEDDWRRLMEDAARHTIDIDIYHTDGDKAAFNGGLFWHTDHYQDAATATHRTYSRANAAGKVYGGGPSNEHNYTTGLLQYYYLSGDPEAHDAVLSLANWVVAMDDGAQTLLAVVGSMPTGNASKTVSTDYHKPGRGAGNSINALLDAYQLSREHRYMLKADELLQRCIHPHDDIAALQLDQPEHRWSYLVFLQVLGKYLDVKVEWGEMDYGYCYARDSLLHYAQWLLLHELPYKDVLYKVELPTETWPAQDVRKCHVLHLAAKYGPVEQQAAFRQRAGFFFERCLEDLLSFKTAYLTRPQVLLSVYGLAQAYFEKHGYVAPQFVQHNHQFGVPRQFRTQRDLLKDTVVQRVSVVAAEFRRLVRDKFGVLRRRWSKFH